MSAAGVHFCFDEGSEMCHTVAVLFSFLVQVR
jgi:hypothetical protein